jgi:hypothetical protein
MLVAMAVTLPLHKMSLSEKLRAMEALWEDLSRHADALESPDWHGAVLAEREKLAAAGKSRFKDWETAKKDIRKRVA